MSTGELACSYPTLILSDDGIPVTEDLIQNVAESGDGKTELEELPQALLTYIVSLLRDSDACQTSILSKRWRNHWMFRPNLRMVMPDCQTSEQADKFYDLVDKTLLIREGMSIQKFLLSCTVIFDYSRLYNWLFHLAGCKVESFVLKLPARIRRCYSKPKVTFTWHLFSSLVEFTLKGDFEINVPKGDVLFPCLKKLTLISCEVDCLSWISLIMGSPALEELSVKHYAVTENLTNLRDCDSSFKRFEIRSKKTSKLMFHQYRYSEDFCIFHPRISAKPLAYVEIYYCKSEGPMYIEEANILTLSSSSLEALVLQGIDKFNLSKVFKLTIDNISTWKSLLVLLNSVPNLEHITFSDGISHDESSWIPPMEPPACLQLKMKEIIIVNRKTVNCEEFSFLLFLLKYSKNLERLKINAHLLDPTKLKQLEEFHRGLCQIEIVETPPRWKL